MTWLESWGSAKGLEPTVWRFTEEDIIVPGTAPIAPLSFDDLEGVETFVVKMTIGPENAPTRLALLTNVEGLEGVPRGGSSDAPPAPGADLSASGAAVILHALAGLQDEAAGWDHAVDAYFFTGELGFRGWAGLSLNPWSRAVGTGEVGAYTHAIGIQNVGSCNREFLQPSGTWRHEWTQELAVKMAPRFAEAGFNLSGDLLSAAYRETTDFGFHIHPAVRWGKSIPTIMVADGWWAHKTLAGTAQDTLANICEGKVEDLVPVVVSLLRDPIVP